MYKPLYLYTLCFVYRERQQKFKGTLLWKFRFTWEGVGECQYCAGAGISQGWRRQSQTWYLISLPSEICTCFTRVAAGNSIPMNAGLMRAQFRCDLIPSPRHLSLLSGTIKTRGESSVGSSGQQQTELRQAANRRFDVPVGVLQFCNSILPPPALHSLFSSTLLFLLTEQVHPELKGFKIYKCLHLRSNSVRGNHFTF